MAMSFICKTGFHKWDGCICTVCGKIRDEHHTYGNDCGTCLKCGTVHNELHNWTSNCEKCSVCGKTRTGHHNWLTDCEKCSICGTTRTDHHHIVNGICSICGQGTFTDIRDGRTYKAIKIGNQIIMEENLAFKPEKGNFWAYDDNVANISQYGYLYDWETAKTLAPKGWHLPARAEWESLFNALGGNANLAYEHAKVGGNSGFNGLLGGLRFLHGEFNSLGASGCFWSSTPEGEDQAAYFKLSAYSKHAEIAKAKHGAAMSVRLFRD
jgi:uncharacterized protein (TIGR02145 family)